MRRCLCSDECFTLPSALVGTSSAKFSATTISVNSPMIFYLWTYGRAQFLVLCHNLVYYVPYKKLLVPRKYYHVVSNNRSSVCNYKSFCSCFSRNSLDRMKRHIVTALQLEKRHVGYNEESLHPPTYNMDIFCSITGTRGLKRSG